MTVLRTPDERFEDLERMAGRVFGALDLEDVTLFFQDWGGLIGLRLVGTCPERFARVVAANTGLPTGDRPPSKAFLVWQRYRQESPGLPVGAILPNGCSTKLSVADIAALIAKPIGLR